MAWIYLFIASLFEIVWTFCLKFMDFKKITAINYPHFFDATVDNLKIIGPLAGYIVFGLGNVVFFSMATKQIPISTAMAVWIGVALIGVKLVDMFVFKEAYNFAQFFFFGLILVGVIGLKASTAVVK